MNLLYNTVNLKCGVLNTTECVTMVNNINVSTVQSIKIIWNGRVVAVCKMIVGWVSGVG